MKQSLDHISAIRQLWNEGYSPREIKRIMISRRYFRKSRYRGEKTPEAILSFIQQRCREFELSGCAGSSRACSASVKTIAPQELVPHGSRAKAQKDALMDADNRLLHPGQFSREASETAAQPSTAASCHDLPASKESGLSAAIVFRTQCENSPAEASGGRDVSTGTGKTSTESSASAGERVESCGTVEGHGERALGVRQQGQSLCAKQADGCSDSRTEQNILARNSYDPAPVSTQTSPARNSTPKSLGTPEIGKGSLNTGATITSVVSVPTPRNSTPTLERKPPRKANDDLVERLMRLAETPKKAGMK